MCAWISHQNDSFTIEDAKKAGVRHCFIEDESEREMINVPASVAYLRELK